MSREAHDLGDSKVALDPVTSFFSSNQQDIQVDKFRRADGDLPYSVLVFSKGGCAADEKPETLKIALESNKSSSSKPVNSQVKRGGRYEYGGTSVVKRGYLVKNGEVDFSRPVLAVKIMEKSVATNSEALQSAGKLGADFLGRVGFTFERNEKFYFLTNWFSGENLFDLSSCNVNRGLPLEGGLINKVKIFLDLVEELVRIHEAGYVFGDLSPEQCIVNLGSSSGFGFGKLVDLDSIRREKQKGYGFLCKFPYFSPRMLGKAAKEIQSNVRSSLEPTVGQYLTREDDLYQMAYIFAFLFPEFFCLHQKVITLTDITRYPILFSHYTLTCVSFEKALWYQPDYKSITTSFQSVFNLMYKSASVGSANSIGARDVNHLFYEVKALQTMLIAAKETAAELDQALVQYRQRRTVSVASIAALFQESGADVSDSGATETEPTRKRKAGESQAPGSNKKPKP